MPTFAIVTDSGAHFPDPNTIARVGVDMLILPNKLNIAGKQYRESVDLGAEDAIRLMANQPTAPTVIPPSVAEYIAAFERLARIHDSVICICPSREVFAHWQYAKAAAQQFGHSGVAVIDSGSISAGQAMLTLATARAIARGARLDDVVRIARGAVDRLYAIFHIETMDYVQQNGILSPSHSILGTMMGMKPFLTIEHGKLMPIEKARTRLQAVERLVEFVVEFASIEDAVILQNRYTPTEQTRMLQERLAAEFEGRAFPHLLYGASLTALLGVETSGIIVLERENDRTEIEDDV